MSPLRVARVFAPPDQPWLSGHRGIDLRVIAGDEVRAVDDGVVLWAGDLAGIPVVSVAHDGGLRSTYQPVEPSVEVGQSVRAGDLLGQVQAAGSHCAPASCLHLGAKRGQQAYVDPALLLGLRRPRLLPYLSSATVPVRTTAALPERAAAAAASDAPGEIEQVVSWLASALAAVDAATVAT